jgi:hypothetical protein
VSDIFSVMPDYSDGVGPQEMMQLMLSDNTDSGDGARQCCISRLGESIGEGPECNLSVTLVENI